MRAPHSAWASAPGSPAWCSTNRPESQAVPTPVVSLPHPAGPDPDPAQIDAYLKVRKMVSDQLPKIRATPSAQELAERKGHAGCKSCKSTFQATQGSVFTPAVAAEFRA